jgi:hypothetical protein
MHCTTLQCKFGNKSYWLKIKIKVVSIKIDVPLSNKVCDKLNWVT